MKKSIIAAAAFVLIGFAGNAFAQNSATANGTANATVISPIAISANPGDLEFGNIVSTTGGGNVTESGGTDSYAPGQDPGAGNYATIHDAVFTVTGNVGSSFNYSSSAVSLTTSPVMAGFSLVLNGANGGPTVILAGGNTITVGGTLTVPGNSGAVAVSGTWVETAAY